MVHKELSGKRETYGSKPLSKGNNLGVRLVGVIEERGVTGVIPEPEHEVTESGAHPVPELVSVDVVVHRPVQDQVWEVLDGVHQGSFVLGVWDGPDSDIWVLTGNGTHPGVLDSLVELITVSNARLGELLCGGSESGEGWI